MRKINFSGNVNDGVRPRENDFIALQDYTQVLRKLVATVGKGFIAEGCVVSGTLSSATVSAGVVMLGGELRTFAGATGVDLTTPKYLVAIASTTTTPRPTFLGSTLDRFTFLACEVSSSPAGSDYDHVVLGEDVAGGIIQGKTFADLFLLKSEIASPNITLPYATAWSCPDVGLEAIYKKNLFNSRIELCGNVIYAGGGSGLIATLPAGYRPLSNRYFNVYDKDFNAVRNVSINASTGAILLLNSFPTGTNICLDSIAFYTNV